MKRMLSVFGISTKRFPDREAAVFVAESIRWTYAEFAAEVDRLAGACCAWACKPETALGYGRPTAANGF